MGELSPIADFDYPIGDTVSLSGLVTLTAIKSALLVLSSLLVDLNRGSWFILNGKFTEVEGSSKNILVCIY